MNDWTTGLAAVVAFGTASASDSTPVAGASAPVQLTCWSVYPMMRRRVADIWHARISDLVYALKDGVPFRTKETLTTAGALVHAPTFIADAFLECEAFDPRTVLVPIPRSSASIDVNSKEWSGLQLARALHHAGHGAGVVFAIRRAISVPSSAKSGPSQRVTVATHLASFAVDASKLVSAKRIALIDDVVTKGSTLAAAVTALRGCGVTAEIVGFTVSRVIAPSATHDRDELIPSEINWDGVSSWPRCTRIDD